MGRNVNELQKEYENEFLEFLIQKINHAGGSLQFQHLSGLLQQLRFEIRDAFGVTKSSLMKFLKSHSNTFTVNSKGVVTIVISSMLDDNDLSNEESSSTTPKKTFLPEIKKGKGFILKIFPEYAIIKARSPVRTYIFFTPLEYGGDKDSLFVDFELHVQNEVYFNAIHGHSDYEIEYRATEVWRNCDSDEESVNPENLKKNNITKTEKFTGEGVIKKLFPNVGFISVSDKEIKNVFFYRANIKDHNIKLGNQIEFVAEFILGEWQATEIIKKKKLNQPSESSQMYSKKLDKCNSAEKYVKNEPGLIYPYSTGAIIKFGKNYSELAECNLCNFYFYGIRVANTDIAMEFSEGCDVKFDAVKSKNSPGWKAVLVWTGEKPVNIKIDKKIFEENYNYEITENIDPDETTSDLSSKTSDFLLRTKFGNNNKKVNKINNNNKTVNKGHGLRNKSKTRIDSPPRQNFNKLSVDHCKNITSNMASQKLSSKDSKYNQDKSRKHRNRKSNNKFFQEKPFQKTPKVDNIEKNNEKLCTSKDTDLDTSESSESTSEENNELQDSSGFSRKFLKEDKQYLSEITELPKNLKNETDSERDAITSEKEKDSEKRKSSIKKFEAIDGEVINLYCKFAIVESDHLTKDVDFILNAFYVDGKSVEEKQVIDLKEVIKVGDIIKFNCFEIIDDYGEMHQRVTMAWKGDKPNVYEIKPEEFILEQELCVSVSDELDYECNPEERFETIRRVNFEEATESYSEVESSQNNMLHETSHEYSIISQNRTENVEENLSSDTQHENLPYVILNKLETCGFIFSESKNVLNIVQEIIDVVVKNSNVGNLSVNEDCTSRNDSETVCSSCGKTNKEFIKEATTTNTAVQTVVTGEIVATSIFTEDR